MTTHFGHSLRVDTSVEHITLSSKRLHLSVLVWCTLNSRYLHTHYKKNLVTLVTLVFLGERAKCTSLAKNAYRVPDTKRVSRVQYDTRIGDVQCEPYRNPENCWHAVSYRKRVRYAVRVLQLPGSDQGNQGNRHSAVFSRDKSKCCRCMHGRHAGCESSAVKAKSACV